MQYDLDDPRLTAYALGELDDPADRAAIEAHLADDPESRRFVDEVRATADLLTQELRHESGPGLDDGRRREIESCLERDGSPLPSVRPNYAPWYAYAVAATLLIGTGLLAMRAVERQDLLRAPADTAAPPQIAMNAPGPQERGLSETREFPGLVESAATEPSSDESAPVVGDLALAPRGTEGRRAEAVAGGLYQAYSDFAAQGAARDELARLNLEAGERVLAMEQAEDLRREAAAQAGRPLAEASGESRYASEMGNPESLEKRTGDAPAQLPPAGVRGAARQAGQQGQGQQAQQGLGQQGEQGQGQPGQQGQGHQGQPSAGQALGRPAAGTPMTTMVPPPSPPGAGGPQAPALGDSSMDSYGMMSGRGMMAPAEAGQQATEGTPYGRMMGGMGGMMGGVGMMSGGMQPASPDQAAMGAEPSPMALDVAQQSAGPARPPGEPSGFFDQSGQPHETAGAATRAMRMSPGTENLAAAEPAASAPRALDRAADPNHEQQLAFRFAEPGAGPTVEAEVVRRDGTDRVESQLAEPPLLLRQRVAPPADVPSRMQFAPVVDNPFRNVLDEPLSTFSIDVDTASYAIVRRYLLDQNLIPPPGAARIEELVNYFDYDYPEPGDAAEPFYADVEVVRCPWNAEHRLARIGLQGRSLANEDRPPGNLVFLVDVSGSMNQPDKLPLLRDGLKALVDQLQEGDHVAIVTYANDARVALPPTPAEQRPAILGAIDALQASGSTNGGAGLDLAYDLAAMHFDPEGTNRVLLATDGDFNVGVTDDDTLVRLIEEKARSNVFLTILGFGSGNLQDAKLEAIADRGNGNYHVIDAEAEARKVLVEQLTGTLVTIAKDVKLQLDFNPAKVAAYRLIGYENRTLEARDFDDDTKDAGEIGAGHSVTALYELVPPGRVQDVPEAERSRYVEPAGPAEPEAPESFALNLRYKLPKEDQSRLIVTEVVDDGRDYAVASDDTKFAASVAAFGMILRDSPHRGNATLDAVIELAESALGDDPQGRRAEFVAMVRKARELSGQAP